MNITKSNYLIIFKIVKICFILNNFARVAKKFSLKKIHFLLTDTNIWCFSLKSNKEIATDFKTA